MDHGCFSDDPRVIWINELGHDRKMRLLACFTFTDPSGALWDAPEKSCLDGASIPPTECSTGPAAVRSARAFSCAWG